MGVAPRSAGRGNRGIYSLVPIMKSNSQNGITLSITGNQNPDQHPAYYAFDGVFPSVTNVSRPQDYTYVNCLAAGKMSIYISFPTKKRIYSLLQIPIAGNGFSIGAIDLYAKDEHGDYVKLRTGENSLGITFMESENVQAYKEYRIDCYRGGTTTGCGIAQLQIFGR